MSHDADRSHHGQDRKLVHMANQIAIFFAHEPEDQAVAAIETHIRKFWDPRMRAKIIAPGAGDGLSPRAATAIRRLAGKAEPCPST